MNFGGREEAFIDAFLRGRHGHSPGSMHRPSETTLSAGHWHPERKRDGKGRFPRVQ